MPWLMTHVVDTSNRRRVDTDGKPPHRRWTGTKFKACVAHVGENTILLKLDSVDNHHVE